MGEYSVARRQSIRASRPFDDPSQLHSCVISGGTVMPGFGFIEDALPTVLYISADDVVIV
jgi:hypothetical protein